MQLENIWPARTAGKSDQISSEEFQKTLYNWFEKKGIVANLRSHLRVQMINHLKNTSIGGKLDYQKANCSLSQQAFNLVIAEHLLRIGCHYTLSVFSTEAPPVASQLPIATLEASKFEENEKWRFDEESVENVLELIGISKHSEENIKIRTFYFQNNKSLLSCIITSKFVKANDRIITDIEDNGDFISYFTKIMEIFGAPIRVIHDLNSKIQQYIRKENDDLCVKYQKKIDDLKNLLTLKDTEIVQIAQEHINLKKELRTAKSERKTAKKRIDDLLAKEEELQIRDGVLQGRLLEIDKLENDLKVCLEASKQQCAQKHCDELCENNVKVVEKLQKDIEKLHDINQEKSLEIEKLQSKISLLVNDLQNSQLKINFLNCCLEKSSEMNLFPVQNVEKLPDRSNSSDNITDEILQQVRTRLEVLEKESDDLDVKFKNFKLNKVI